MRARRDANVAIARKLAGHDSIQSDVRPAGRQQRLRSYERGFHRCPSSCGFGAMFCTTLCFTLGDALTDSIGRFEVVGSLSDDKQREGWLCCGILVRKTSLRGCAFRRNALSENKDGP